MLKTLTAILFSAAVTVGALDTSAFAVTTSPAPSKVSSQSGLYQDAEVNLSIGVGGFGGYDRYRNGDRCRFRRDGCSYFHQGYYYNNPWWLVPGLVIGDNGYNNHRGYGRHADWCASRYRSYDLRSNTWMSNSGQRRRCNSPF